MDASGPFFGSRLAGLCAGTLMLSACAGGNAMKAQYSQSSVEPVQARTLDNQRISLRYRVYPESMYYSKGVDYRIDGDTIKVYIARCSIKEACTPMAETVIPLDGKWEAEVHLPHHGEKVVVVHSDAEEQVYP
jgi:hypothetical protein